MPTTSPPVLGPPLLLEVPGIFAACLEVERGGCAGWIAQHGGVRGLSMQPEGGRRAGLLETSRAPVAPVLRALERVCKQPGRTEEGCLPFSKRYSTKESMAFAFGGNA